VARHWSNPPPWQVWFAVALLATIPLTALWRFVEFVLSLLA